MNYQDKSTKELIEELERYKLENEKRIADLVIADKEIIYQNQEKENRADELFLSNSTNRQQTIIIEERKENERLLKEKNEEYLRLIEELKYAKLKKEESESKHKFLFDNSPLGKIYQNANGEINDANRSAERILGLTLEQLQGLTSIDPRWKSIHEDGSDFPGDTHPAAITLQTGKPVYNSIMGVFNPITNNYTWININSIPRFKDGNNKPFEVIATFEDITERKLTEQKLRESEILLRSTLDNMMEGCQIIDREFRYAYVNAETERQLGRPKEELLGKIYYEIFPAIIENPMFGFINECMINHTNKNFLNEFIFPDGRVGCYKINIEPVPEGVLILSEDISDHKKAEAEIKALNETLEQKVIDRTNQLEAVNKELESFSYSVSHDLRAPLRGIDGFSRILQKDFTETLNDQGLDYLARIRKASQTMGQLIDDMLKLSRVTKAEMKIEKVNLSEIVASITNEIKELNLARKAEFVIQSNIEVSGDKNLLRIALQNLISNAWKYSSKNDSTKIEFGKTIQEDSTVYFIRDNGVGFNMKYVNKLFGAFQRLHSVSEFEGTGIGLATVNRIIVKHGGSIWAEAEINKGASFYFKL
ncbi:MAG: PAS domain S-box protein [Leptospiraceae bacterium]|nr:PAS domain S-box protein [Leptospiraceae bacterium]